MEKLFKTIYKLFTVFFFFSNIHKNNMSFSWIMASSFWKQWLSLARDAPLPYESQQSHPYSILGPGRCYQKWKQAVRPFVAAKCIRVWPGHASTCWLGDFQCVSAKQLHPEQTQLVPIISATEASLVPYCRNSFCGRHGYNSPCFSTVIPRQ